MTAFGSTFQKMNRDTKLSNFRTCILEITRKNGVFISKFWTSLVRAKTENQEMEYEKWRYTHPAHGMVS